MGVALKAPVAMAEVVMAEDWVEAEKAVAAMEGGGQAEMKEAVGTVVAAQEADWVVVEMVEVAWVVAVLALVEVAVRVPARVAVEAVAQGGDERFLGEGGASLIVRRAVWPGLMRLATIASRSDCGVDATRRRAVGVAAC